MEVIFLDVRLSKDLLKLRWESSSTDSPLEGVLYDQSEFCAVKQSEKGELYAYCAGNSPNAKLIITG